MQWDSQLRVLQIINEVYEVGEYHENSDADADKIEKCAERLRKGKESVDERVQKTRWSEDPKERVAESWAWQCVDVRQGDQQKYRDVLDIVHMCPADTFLMIRLVCFRPAVN
jgi:hypothetical protein